MSAADLIAKGFGGYQGWGDAEADANFKDTGGEGKKTSGGGSASSTPNYSLSDAGVGSSLDFAISQDKPIQDALSAYTMAIRGQQNPLDIYSQLETAAGLPGMKTTAATLREQVGSLEDAIKRAEGEVNATTGQSLVTEAQRSGMVNAKRKPMLENLSTLTTGLGRLEQGITAASQGISEKTSLALKGQEQQLKPLEMGISVMQDRAARLTTGFTADSQNKLSLYLQKIQRQEAISDREADQAFELLKLENNYNNEISKMIKQSEIDIAETEKKKKIADSNSGVTVNTQKYYGVTTPSTTGGYPSYFTPIG